jgi:hypothetical protein
VGNQGKYSTAVGRWQGVGPYYAMFPTAFADAVIASFTEPGDVVVDPFAGRGTAVFSAAHQSRIGLGVEINPVGWTFAMCKLYPGKLDGVKARLGDLAKYSHDYDGPAESLPPFFSYCFSARVRRFLLAAREHLDWRNSQVDRTVMAMLMVYLHGKRGAALSNQMRQTKSMAPDYAIKWWKERALDPPDLDPVSFMMQRLTWRYAKGLPSTGSSYVHLGNSEVVLKTLQAKRRGLKPARLLFTSPPYYRVTNYHYDQWLRLWLLGGPPTARRRPGGSEIRAKFEGGSRYRQLLQNVFECSSELLADDSVIYVRTGLGAFTFETTLDVLRAVFPNHRMRQMARPYSRPTQTSLFGDSGSKAGEVDLVMTMANECSSDCFKNWTCGDLP